MTPGTDIRRFDVRSFLAEIDPDSRLELYYELLADENRKVNLVSRETLPGIDSGQPDRFALLRVLAAESLFPLRDLNRNAFAQYLDIGSGGGFPAIPILLTQHIADATLVERTLKKAAALRRMLSQLNQSAKVEPVTFEETSVPHESFDLITLRLVRLTPPILKKILPLLTPGGTLVYYSRPQFTPILSNFEQTALQYSASETGNAHTCTFFRRIR